MTPPGKKGILSTENGYAYGWGCWQSFRAREPKRKRSVLVR
jgi:hypothetical protein